MKTMPVVAHPRRESLTFAAAQAFATQLERRGATLERADLVREGFDAALRQLVEPDWADPGKRYPNAVHAEMARTERNEATVLVCPVWWWSAAALLKGWINRVRNNGWAYGGRSYPHRSAWKIGNAGTSATAIASVAETRRCARSSRSASSSSAASRSASSRCYTARPTARRKPVR
jgi:NAD(P)H dehydrogenase (quinone)